MKVMSCGLNPYTNFKAQLTVLNANKEAVPVVDEHKAEWESKADGIGTKKDNIYLCIMPSVYAPVGEKKTEVYVPVAAYASIEGHDYYDDLSSDITRYNDEKDNHFPKMLNECLDYEVSHFMEVLDNAYRNNPDKHTRLSSPR